MRKLLILAAVMLLVPSVSFGASLEDLLVEKGVITKSEAKASMEGGAAKVYWNKGTRLEFPNEGFTFGVKTIIQVRYTYDDADEGFQDSSGFSLRRVRLVFAGTALHNEFSYKIQTDLASDQGGSQLKDAYLTWHVCDWADLRMGQWKTPVSRQFNTSSTKLQFANRSNASNMFEVGRQPGGMVGMHTEDDEFTFGLALWNGLSDGEGINRGPQGTDMAWSGALRWNAMGEINAYSEGDMDYSEDHGLSFGLAYFYSDDQVSGDFLSSKVKTSVGSFDLIWKYQGFSLAAEYFLASVDANARAEKFEPTGFYVQAGYFFEPEVWEVAGRWDYVDCDNGVDDFKGDCTGYDKQQLAEVSLNYHWWKHHLKAQIGYAYIRHELLSGDKPKSNRWMLQLASYF